VQIGRGSRCVDRTRGPRWRGVRRGQCGCLGASGSGDGRGRAGGSSDQLDEHVHFGCERGPGCGPCRRDAAVFGGVYAAAAPEILLRGSRSVSPSGSPRPARHLLSPAAITPRLDGTGEQALADVDSLLSRVYGHARQGASCGHTKISGTGW